MRSIKQVLTGHTSEDSAYIIQDYPYGFKLRCKMRVWIEYKETKGFRFCSRTTNPKKSFEVWNAIKYSTYSNFAMAMYLDNEDKVQHAAIGHHSSAQDVLDFVKDFSPKGVDEQGEVIPGADYRHIEAYMQAKVMLWRKFATDPKTHPRWKIGGVERVVSLDEQLADLNRYSRELRVWEEVNSLLNC